MDWYIPYSFVKKHNLDMAQDIDKFNVTNKMLRTSSFGILLFAIIFTQFFLNGYSPVYAILGVSCLIFAVILAREAVKFSRWFYQSIFHSLVAIIAKPEQMPSNSNQRQNAQSLMEIDKSRKSRRTKHAADFWESARLTSIFLASSFFLLPSRVHACSLSAGANRWAFR